MPSLASALRPLLWLAFMTPLTCGGGSAPEYGPKEDDQAMTAIGQCWLPPEEEGLVITLEEDLELSEIVPNLGCEVEHVVRGKGLGEPHQGTESSVGCGGCPMEVVAYVTGTVEGGPFTDTLAVTGRVVLGSNYDQSPYDYPYQIALDAVDGDNIYRLEGTMTDSELRVEIRLPSRTDWTDEAGEHSLEPVEW
jgi:hypothetical protein